MTDRAERQHLAKPERAHPAQLTSTLIISGGALGFGAGTMMGVLSDIADLVGADTGQLNLITTVQLMVTVIVVPIIGRLGDRFGHRRLLTFALGLTAIGAVLIAVAPTLGVLLVGRALQGAIGTVFVVGPALARDRLSKAQGDRAIAAGAGSMFLGVLVGMTSVTAVGGSATGTRAALWIAAAVYFIATLYSLFCPDSQMRQHSRLDLIGAGLLTLGLGAVVLGIHEAEVQSWGDWRTVGLLLGGLLVLVAWVRNQAGKEEPLIDVKAIGNRRVLPPVLIAFAFGVAQYGAQAAVITYMRGDRDELGYGLSLSANQFLLTLGPCIVLSFIVALAAPRLVAVAGTRAVFVLGSSCLALGFGLVVVEHDTLWVFVLGLALQWGGQGCLQAMWPLALSAAAEPDERGATTGVGQSLETLGGGLSSALFATIMGSLVIVGTATPTVAAYTWVWAICGIVALVMIPMAFALKTRPPESATPKSEETPPPGIGPN